jgi:hypothetical protein
MRIVKSWRVCPAETMLRVNKPEASTHPSVPQPFRRLKRNELVSPSGFIVDERGGFKPSERPGRFHADALVKQIYRRDENGSIAIERLK